MQPLTLWFASGFLPVAFQPKFSFSVRGSMGEPSSSLWVARGLAVIFALPKASCPRGWLRSDSAASGSASGRGLDLEKLNKLGLNECDAFPCLKGVLKPHGANAAVEGGGFAKPTWNCSIKMRRGQFSLVLNPL